MKFLALPVEVCEHDVRTARKLPDDLATGSTRRRQRLSVSDNRELRERAFTFRQRFPDGDALGANRQTITRTLDIAAGINPAAGSPDGRTDLKIGKRRHCWKAGLLGRFTQRL